MDNLLLFVFATIWSAFWAYQFACLLFRIAEDQNECL